MLLSNNRNVLPLYRWLTEKEETVNLYSGRLTKMQILNMKPKLTISYNYNYIISKKIIQLLDGNIINLHISLLPWNRGSDPNFWSFIDNTPKGVTIHKLEEGLDTGDIIVQEQIMFDEEKLSFQQTYDILNSRIKELLYNNYDQILNKTITPIHQPQRYSYHERKDFQQFMKEKSFTWDVNIAQFKNKYKL